MSAGLRTVQVSVASASEKLSRIGLPTMIAISSIAFLRMDAI